VAVGGRPSHLDQSGEHLLNKRKKVAIHKHRVKRKKMEEKRRMSTIARRR
jgi:hypothetical protein